MTISVFYAKRLLRCNQDPFSIPYDGNILSNIMAVSYHISCSPSKPRSQVPHQAICNPTPRQVCSKDGQSWATQSPTGLITAPLNYFRCITLINSTAVSENSWPKGRETLVQESQHLTNISFSSYLCAFHRDYNAYLYFNQYSHLEMPGYLTVPWGRDYRCIMGYLWRHLSLLYRPTQSKHKENWAGILKIFQNKAQTLISF